ncbi:MAG TPA: amidohydrolase family protein [Methylomirabilota bacterium]|nr:amidohydrolase family protein [Methylomirabilota bacterium]
MPEFDVIIRGGTVVDGARNPRQVTDVGVKDGKIAKIGRLNPSDAKKTLDANGLVVAPGFVDLHTHYDAQINWDPYCTLSGWHGVTSIVVGNCGFGFAPCKPELRDRAMLTMSRVEAIPFDSMKAGMKWEWVTFPEWLNFLDRTPKGLNVLSYVPLAPIMIWVMGLEAAKTRPATEKERQEMQRILNESMDAGGCGFSCQRLGNGFVSVQRDYDGTPMVTDTMAEEDLLAFAEVLGKRKEGFIQLTQASEDFKADMRLYEKLAEISGRPVLFNATAVRDDRPALHRRTLRYIDDANRRGHRIYNQTATMRQGFYFTFEDWNLFDGSDVWREMTLGTPSERKQKFQNPALRQALIEEYEAGRTPFVTGAITDFTIESVGDAKLQKYVGKTVGQVAQAEGKHPIVAMLDIVVADDMRTEFETPARNVNPEYAAELMSSEYSIPGVSDGGAHTKFVTIGAYPTDMITWMVRDAGFMSLEEAHYRLSALPAKCAGFQDRGVLREGAPADIVVYDLQNLKMVPEKPMIVHDFPAGEWRRVQYAEGYRWIMVNGEVTFEDGKCTNATPGRLLRHGRG